MASLNYEELDWTNSNKQLSIQHGLPANHFAIKRVQFAAETISDKYAPRVDWEKVPNSWWYQLSLAEIGRRTNSSRENCRQRRNRLIKQGILKDL